MTKSARMRASERRVDRASNNRPRAADVLEKAPTGIAGFDEITLGGLPRGRTSLICGGPGCGKTLLAIEFLVNGARTYSEPGVFIAFEENEQELAANAASLKLDLDGLRREGLLAIDHVRIDPNEITESGEYDLEGLFIRIRHAIESVKAKRIVLDTIETLFSGFSNEALLRAEIRRLFQFLKSFGVTAIVTGERGERALTRYGLEEYVADCVILLDQRVADQITTRRLRIVKYRGTSHGSNEYPFIIGEHGFSILPVTSMSLRHKVSSEIVSSGVPDLDTMLGRGGFYRGSSVLISGTAGTGKTSFACSFARSLAEHGENVLYFTFEESPDQIVRNMSSIGVDLRQHLDSGRLRIIAERPFVHGLEMHLVSMHKSIDEFRPGAVIVDPVSNLISAGDPRSANATITLLIDFLKQEGITAFLTVLTQDGRSLEATELGISSIIDTWMLVRDIELSGERNRGLYLLKARGMPHSNQIREFLLSDQGIKLEEIYLGPSGMLTGSARVAVEAEERNAALGRQQQKELRLAQLERKRKVMEARIAALRAEFEAEEVEVKREISYENAREGEISRTRTSMARSRQVNGRPTAGSNEK